MINYLDVMSEKVFTWQNPDTLEELTIASDRITEWARLNFIEIVLTPVERKWALDFLDHRGIEQHRLERIQPEHLEEPIVYCAMPDGTHLLVDGHHRYVAAAIHDVQWIKSRILNYEQWSPFIVEGLPQFGRENLLNSFSGIK